MPHEFIVLIHGCTKC